MTDAEIEAELEDYRRELLAEREGGRGKVLSFSKAKRRLIRNERR